MLLCHSMSTPLQPSSSGEAILASMNASVYQILSAGTVGYEDICPTYSGLVKPPTEQRMGFAYDQTSGIGKNKKAIDHFLNAFFGPEPPPSSGAVLLKQLSEEFADADSREVIADLSADKQKVAGNINGSLLYKIIEPPPEIIRERNFILYSFVGQVLIRARYVIDGAESTVAHSLLTLSRNAYSPSGDVPTVQVGLPARNFRLVGDT